MELEGSCAATTVDMTEIVFENNLLFLATLHAQPAHPPRPDPYLAEGITQHGIHNHGQKNFS